MKKTYTKKQITEAIAYWKRQLNEKSYAEQTMMSNIKGEGFAYKAFCEFTPADSEYDAEYEFKKLYQVLVYAKDKKNDYIMIGDDRDPGIKDLYFELDGVPCSTYDLAYFNDVDIKATVYAQTLLLAIGCEERGGGPVGTLLAEIKDGGYFGRVDGKRVYEFTDEYQFDKVFNEMCEDLDADVDVDARTIDLKVDDYTRVKLFFVK